ncbi:MAG: ASCH domain-containing protein [Verrucomicrobia bacterium]|nr:ASCH domain-containing protein [Verrucomicrobiota bacterium]
MAQPRRLAISVRQPYAEVILRGIKKIEYRSIPTNIRGRVYVYASLHKPDARDCTRHKLSPEDLPTGYVVGSVEVVGCKWVRGEYNWLLAKPQRLARPFRPQNHPQPVWFYPL